MSWRDHIKVHPAADLFPMMSESELIELGKNIRANSIIVTKIAYYKGELLDGRNRLEAMEREGITLDWANIKDSAVVLHLDASIDPYEYVISANLHRRHLTSEQKRELIDKVLKAKPEVSNAAIAKQTKTTDKTVAKRRRKLESTSEIPKLKGLPALTVRSGRRA